MKSFVYALAGLPAVVLAADFTVQVGPSNSLAFDPPTVTGAANGDVIHFVFNPKNHSVTQSTFASPCAPLAGGENSDFQAYTDTTQPQPTFNFTVADATKPAWFYCAQTLPLVHCNQGMVFAVNPPTSGNTFEAFQNAAKGGAASASAGGASASGAAGATSGGAAGATSGGAAGASPTSGASGAGASPTSPAGTGTGTGTSSGTSASATHSGAAVAVGAPAGMVGMFAGVAAFFALL